MLRRRVLEQLRQLQGVLADLLHGGEEEAVQGDVDHLLQQAAGLKEVPVLALLHEVGELHAGAGVVVAVLRIDGKALLLEGKPVLSGHRGTQGDAPGRQGVGALRQDGCEIPGATLHCHTFMPEKSRGSSAGSGTIIWVLFWWVEGAGCFATLSPPAVT